MNCDGLSIDAAGLDDESQLAGSSGLVPVELHPCSFERDEPSM
jgi:hypothetical protein